MVLASCNARHSVVEVRDLNRRPIGIGWLAEDVFGYDSSVTSEAMEDIAPEVRLRNANALAVGMLVMMVVPWTVCLLAYSGVAYTYPRDREKLKAAQLGLGEKAG